MQLEEIRPRVRLSGLVPGEEVTVSSVWRHGADALRVAYRTRAGDPGGRVVTREDADRLTVIDSAASHPGLPQRDTDWESLELLADTDPAEAKELTLYKHAKARARAVARANEFLRAEGSDTVALEAAADYNPARHLWIVAERDPEYPDEMLVGGPLIVPDEGPVYRAGSQPRQPEFDGLLSEGIPIDWWDFLSHEADKPYWDELQRFVVAERAQHEVYPAEHEVFAALDLTPHENVRVVILGQDPYIRPGEAHGLAFSVRRGVTIPPSLRIIFDELEDDLGIPRPSSGDLTAWAERGVLLLNTVLTVGEGASGSHAGHGWEQFTDAVIRVVNESPQRVVFVLWGRDARAKKKLIDTPKHAVIEGAHPKARPNALDQLPGSKPFSRANALLSEAGREPIDWFLD